MPPREVKTDTGREAGPGAHALLASVGGVFWGSWHKARWVHSNQRVGASVSIMRVCVGGCIRGRPWEVGETVYHKDFWGSPIRNLDLLGALQIAAWDTYLC